MSRTNKFQAVAIMTQESDGRVLTRNVILMKDEHARRVAAALQNIEGLTATPVVRDFDVFGRVFWTNRDV